MYIGKQFEASATVTADRTFFCLSCGFKCPAVVLGVGTGLASSHYMLMDESAALSAKNEAEELAEADAEQALLLVPCPRCRAVNALARKTYHTGTIGRALLAALVGGFLGQLGTVMANLRGTRVPMLVLAGLSAVMVALVRRGRLNVLCSQVTLFPDQAPSGDLSKI